MFESGGRSERFLEMIGLDWEIGTKQALIGLHQREWLLAEPSRAWGILTNRDVLDMF